MSIKVSLKKEKSENFWAKLKNWRRIKNTMATIAKQLFNESHDISLIYWDHENGKENYKILKQIIGIDRLKWENITIEDKLLDKKIDENHIIDAFLLKISWKNKTTFKNITAIFKINKDEKTLIHVHISEPKMLDWWKVKDLDRKYFKCDLSCENIKSKWISNNDVKKYIKLYQKENFEITPKQIAKTIMIDFWWVSLLLWADEVVKLFSPNALLKWTVVQHLSIWENGGIKDYFKHFCEKKPKLRIDHIDAKWLTEWKSILAKWAYTFTLANKDWTEQKVPANFTMIFIHRDWKWMIDLLHSSLKYGKRSLEKLNK
jgi:hypothetical protein